MNLAWVVGITATVLVLAYRFYGRRVAHWLGEDQSCPTPALMFKDDKDFVPTRPSVLFGHHFATIAGAGPILGPLMAVCYGYGPVWLWIVLGGILFGAVHDYAALSISLRENGRSMAEIARKSLGRLGFVVFILFTIIMLVLVTAAFLNAAAASLASEYPLEKLGLLPDQTLLKTRLVDGVVMARIGGIASTSVIVITLAAPLVGFLIYKKNIDTWLAYLVTGVIAVGSVVIGFYLPVTVDPKLWMVILTAYVLAASALPVWFVLQPRDFTNVQILYGGIVLLMVGLVAAGLNGERFEQPAFSLEQIREGNAMAGGIWPMLFVLIACGAISGFHALVSGGTTSKQCWLVKHARPIAFGGMLLESLLAACVMGCVVWGLSSAEYRNLVYPVVGSANPVLAFAVSCGRLFQGGLHIPVALGSVFGILMVEGFVVTTLDSAIRLNRYLFEELWAAILGDRLPKALRGNTTTAVVLNSGLAAGLMFLMCYLNAFQKIWPIFGAANQLLAALVLLVVSLWLLTRKRQAWFTFLPAVFMTLTTIGALLALFFTKYLPDRNISLVVADGLLVLLAAVMAVMALVALARRRKGTPEETAAVGGVG